MHKRTVHQTSVINTKNRQLANDRGDFYKTKGPWTNAEVDQLLNGYFLGWCATSPDPNRDSFQKCLGRTYDSVGTRLRKQGIRYSEAASYEPGPKRIDRTGTPWTDRDMHMLRLAFGPGGRKNCAHVPQWIAKVLGRSEDDVNAYLNRLLKRTTGFSQPPKQEKQRQLWVAVRISVLIGEAKVDMGI